MTHAYSRPRAKTCVLIGHLKHMFELTITVALSALTQTPMSGAKVIANSRRLTLCLGFEASGPALWVQVVAKAAQEGAQEVLFEPLLRF